MFLLFRAQISHSVMHLEIHQISKSTSATFKAKMQQPEEYFVSPTPWVPNSELPLLVYRGACAHCESEDEIKTFLESNGGWLKGVSIPWP